MSIQSQMINWKLKFILLICLKFILIPFKNNSLRHFKSCLVEIPFLILTSNGLMGIALEIEIVRNLIKWIKRKNNSKKSKKNWNRLSMLAKAKSLLLFQEVFCSRLSLTSSIKISLMLWKMVMTEKLCLSNPLNY